MDRVFLGSILSRKDSVSIKKSTLITIVAVLILLSGFFVLGNVAQAVVPPTTINVPTDYPTIQEAINAANPGDTINVAAGTYNENLTIPQPVTLQGVSGANITGSVTIASDNVTIDSFDITNPTLGYGIVSIDHSNISITNNTLHDIGTTLVSGSAQAIYVKSGSVAVTGITILGNHILNVGNTSLVYGSSGSAKGIFIGDSNGSMDFDGITISNNTIAGITASGEAWPVGRGAYGILVNHSTGAAATKNLTISGNTISDLDGLWAHAIGLEGNTPSASVTGNTVSGLTDHKTPSDSVGVRFEDNASAGTVTVDNTNTRDGHVMTNGTALVIVDAALAPYMSYTYAEILLNSAYYYIGVNAFATVQDAINTASSGATINVAAGNYVEAGQLLIDKNLSIVGDSVSKPIIKPTANRTGNNASDAWFLVAPDVTFNLSNVVLDGDTFFVYQAIRSHGTAVINNVNFRNIQGSLSGSPYRGIAILSFGGTVPGGGGSDSHGSGGAPSVLTVTDSTFEQIGRIGILVKGTESTATISGNTYTGKGDGDFLDYAFEFGAGGSGTVNDNTVSDNRGVAAVDGSTSAGILVTDYYGTGTSATITNNTFNGNTDGIAVGYDATDASVVVAHDNNLSGNVNGVSSTNPIVDATNNWWGDASGPTNASNPSGTGVVVSDNVSFNPWYSNAEKTSLAGQPTPQGDNQVLNLPGAFNATTGDNITIDIPADTNVTGPAGWDGTINGPTIENAAKSDTFVSGYSTVIDTIIELGFPDVKLTFNKAVRLLLPGRAGKRIGYARTGEPFREIVNVCVDDTQATNDLLPAEGECKIDVGNDLVVWTKHLTQFIAYTLNAITAASPVGNTYGGGGAAVAPTPIVTAPATSTVPTGQVLGATRFNFTSDLSVGMSGDAVTELQKRLTEEGVYSGPITGYFGPLTLAGVKAYQQKYGIPQTGFVGPLTRAQLNASQVAGASTVNIEAIRTQIASLQAQLVALLQQLLQMLQLQAK